MIHIMDYQCLIYNSKVNLEEGIYAFKINTLSNTILIFSGIFTLPSKKP